VIGIIGAFWPLNWAANIAGAIFVVLTVMLSKRNARQATFEKVVT
jgi:formate/nitrite transporter FocA (FNT family)